MNVTIGLVALLLAMHFVPAFARGRDARRLHLDLVGSLLLGGGVLTLLVPLVESETGDVSRLRPLLGLCSGAGIDADPTAVLRRRHVRHPLLLELAVTWAVS